MAILALAHDSQKLADSSFAVTEANSKIPIFFKRFWIEQVQIEEAS